LELEVLKLNHIFKIYGDRVQYIALKDINLSIEKGEFVGIMGPSGSGKTTLLNVISTIDPPTSGEVLISGENPYNLDNSKLALFRRRKLGFVFQDFNLIDTLTIGENIVLPLTLDGQNVSVMDKKLKEVAAWLNIENILTKRTYEVSGGQAQRTAIARAIIHSPLLLLADEPTGNLDSKAAKDVMELFESINRDTGVTIVMVTHDPKSASYCHRVIFIKDGRFFNEIHRGDSRQKFYQQIIDVLSLLGGEADDIFQFALNNVKRNTRVYLAYFLSSVFTIMVFFSFAVNLFHPVISSKSGGAIELIMGQTEAAILIFSFLFVFISVNAFLKVRSKEFGVLMILGMSKKQIRQLVFLENMMIGCLAVIVGITIGLVFSKLLLMVLSSILSYDPLSFYFPYKAILITTGFFTLIFLGISALTPLIIRTSNIITLLKGTKKTDREIEFSIILSIASLLLLGSGYFMALSPQLYGINPFLDRIVLFIENVQYAEVILTTSVVIGTYLFFSQLSIFILHRLKRNRNFYMNKTNILWISDLIYRIRDNTRMLFLVTILSAVAFTAITGVYALSSVVKDESLKDNPFALTFTSYGSNDNEQQQIRIIEEMLNSYGFNYERYKSEVIKQVSGDNHTIHIIRLSDYNNRASAIGLEQMTLDKDQALLVPVYVRFDPKRDKTLSQKNIVLDNGEINLEVVGIAPKVIFYSGLFQNLVVVNDETYKKITSIQEKYHSYSYDIPDWLNTLEVTEKLREELGVGAI